MDVWGPVPISSFTGFKYCLLILDDFTKYIWIFPTMDKSDVKHHVDQFRAFVHTQFGIAIKAFRFDKGGEFIKQYLYSVFADLGIVHQTSCLYTPEKNGSAERKHRHLIETTITLLHQANLPYIF